MKPDLNGHSWCESCFSITIGSPAYDFISLTNRNSRRYVPPDIGSIDYCYPRPSHISQLNYLLRTVFWPDIDGNTFLFKWYLALLRQYRIVWLLRTTPLLWCTKSTSFIILLSTEASLVIGCGLMTPEGYITYVAVHPRFQGIGISNFIIFHLIQVMSLMQSSPLIVRQLLTKTLLCTSPSIIQRCLCTTSSDSSLKRRYLIFIDSTFRLIPLSPEMLFLFVSVIRKVPNNYDGW